MRVETTEYSLTPERSEYFTRMLMRDYHLKQTTICCPKCTSYFITANSPIVAFKYTAPRQAIQTLTCRDCNFCWEDHYQLVGLKPLLKKVLK